MKILFFSHYFPPEVNAPATRTYEHCLRWVRAGHDVTVVTCVPNCPDGVLYPGYKNRIRHRVEVLDGIRVVRVWTYLAPNAGKFRRIANYVSYMLSAALNGARLSRPDVVVATSPQFFCGWAGALVARRQRVPFVLEIRDIWPESIEAVGAMRNRFLLRRLEQLERQLYLSADHIVAVGQGYRDNILSKVDVGDWISVITNGVDLEQFALALPDRQLFEKWGLAGKFVCTYVGTIGMAHGLEVVLEAAQILRAAGRKDIAFCLVGDGAARGELQAKIEQLQLQPWVRLPGRRPREDIPWILASSDACLIHLRGCELFGTVIPSKMFEAMAMKRPIIMGVRGEARRMVEEAGAGINMEPDSADELAAIVQRLADDSQWAGSLGSAARGYVQEHFNRDKLAARYLELLKRVAGHAGLELPRPNNQGRYSAVAR